MGESNGTGETLGKVFAREISQVYVLRNLAQDKDFLKTISGTLKPEYFDQELHALAAGILLDQFKANKRLMTRPAFIEEMISKLKKALRLKDDQAHKQEIIRPAEELATQVFKQISSPDQELQEKTLKFCRKQELRLTLQESENLINEGAEEGTVQTLLNKCFQAMAGDDDDYIDFFPDTDEFESRLLKDTARRVGTGFQLLDRWMGGGMLPGTETVFMAPPKGGKSSILINVAHDAILHRRKVVYFTNEISAPGIELRMTARMGNFRVRDIQKDPVIRKKSIAARARFYMTHKPQLIVKGYPTKTATPEKLKTFLYSKETALGFKPDLIVVDYADILRSSRVQGGEGQERFVQADIYEQLRALAQEFQCPLVTASQCNRAAVTKRIIQMEDVAEAYAKCAIADHIIAICMTKQEKAKREFRLFYAGSREGETGHAVRCSQDFSRCYVEELKQVPDEEVHSDMEKDSEA